MILVPNIKSYTTLLYRDVHYTMIMAKYLQNGQHNLTCHFSALNFCLHSVLLGECRNLQDLNVSECFNVTVSKTLQSLMTDESKILNI